MENQKDPERAQDHQDIVWKNYKEDQLDWLGNFYNSAGQKGKGALQKAQASFKELEKKLKESHYNKKNRYFIAFAQLQAKKFYRMPKFLPSKYLNNPDKSKQYSLQIIIESNTQHRGPHIQSSNMKKYRYMLVFNFKSVLQVLTKERYKFSNVAKHILRSKKDNSESEIEKQGIIFDVQRGKKVDWNNFHAGLLFVFIRSVSKGLAELQSKFILHQDIKLSNILLFKCQNLSDLSDPVKLAGIIDEIQFKIIDFDHALLLDSQHLGKTKDLIRLQDQINDGFVALQYKVTLSEIPENPQSIKAWIKTRHSAKFVTCIENIAKLIKGEAQQLGNLIQMIKDNDDGLVQKMQEKIQAFKNKYK